jgi:hypothetical protein
MRRSISSELRRQVQGADGPALGAAEPAGQPGGSCPQGMATNIPTHNLSEVIDACVPISRIRRSPSIS